MRQQCGSIFINKRLHAYTQCGIDILFEIIGKEALFRHDTFFFGYIEEKLRIRLIDTDDIRGVCGIEYLILS